MSWDKTTTPISFIRKVFQLKIAYDILIPVFWEEKYLWDRFMNDNIENSPRNWRFANLNSLISLAFRSLLLAPKKILFSFPKDSNVTKRPQRPSKRAAIKPRDQLWQFAQPYAFKSCRNAGCLAILSVKDALGHWSLCFCFLPHSFLLCSKPIFRMIYPWTNLLIFSFTLVMHLTSRHV